jgi:hypothetical protein
MRVKYLVLTEQCIQTGRPESLLVRCEVFSALFGASEAALVFGLKYTRVKCVQCLVTVQSKQQNARRPLQEG